MSAAVAVVALFSSVQLHAMPMPGLRAGWSYGPFGTSLGSAGLVAVNVDADPEMEVLVTAASRGGFFGDDHWFILDAGGGQYTQIYAAPAGPEIANVTGADADHDGVPELYIGQFDGTVVVFDGATFLEKSRFTAGTSLAAVTVADVDADGFGEVIVLAPNLKVFDGDGTLAWTLSVTGRDVAAGNVDSDAALEIVVTGSGGLVVDAASHQIEWSYTNGFGVDVELGDVDGDDIAEIIGAESWYKLTVFDGDKKSPKYDIPTDLDIGALAVADTDGLAPMEILVGDGQWGDVSCFDGKTGAKRWSVPNPEHGVTDVLVADVDPSPGLELLWGAGATSTGPDFLYVVDVSSGKTLWQSLDLVGPLSALDVGDVDGDGQLELVVITRESDSGYGDPVLMVFDAKTHTLKWKIDDLPNIRVWTGARSLRVTDVDGDGIGDIIVTLANLYDGMYQVYDGISHQVKLSSPSHGGVTFTALAVGDVDGDGQKEIVVGEEREHTGAPGVYIRVFDAATATLEWRSIDLGYWVGVYDLALADFDHDGHVEIAATVGGIALYVFDGVSHELKLTRNLTARALATGDYDGDGTTELFVGGDSGVTVLSGSSETPVAVLPIGSGAITTLRFADLMEDGRRFWLVGDALGLATYSAEGDPVWRGAAIDSHLGDYNQLALADVDAAPGLEVLIGGLMGVHELQVVAAESCNGVDDDGNGVVDDLAPIGCDTACGSGTRTCADGVWSDCSAPPVHEEICDGVDNDCDGIVDRMSRSCACGGGTETCYAGSWQGCFSGFEACDGVDNDCDGEVDDDLQDVPCWANCGIGTRSCVNGAWTSCSTGLGPEVCDGFDNDCNGFVDENLVESCACGKGVKTCYEGHWAPCSVAENGDCPASSGLPSWCAATTGSPGVFLVVMALAALRRRRKQPHPTSA